ncbi:MAG: nucleotidyltransferase family protein [Verrucomicrobia bacterium]|nr:nucleotidyltransferase family protein [Verrucomicrobiota bacterium]
MKAFLLGAGIGSRLRPLTDHIPKCLVPVGGEPLLGIWFRLLARHGIHEVLLNTHHLPDPVRDFVDGWKDAALHITLFHEPVLLGSAGTVAANQKFVAGEAQFLIAYADNLTDMNLAQFVQFHAAKRSPFSLGLFPSPEPSQCGIAELDGDARVTAFVEKPAQPRSNLANAGLYLAGPSLFDLIPRKPYTDFGFDVLPKLVGRMYGYAIPGFYRDIGTLERLASAKAEWAARANVSTKVNRLEAQ